jgi:hypothetical protein
MLYNGVMYHCSFAHKFFLSEWMSCIPRIVIPLVLGTISCLTFLMAANKTHTNCLMVEKLLT